MIVVSDTSPITTLMKIGKVGLLRELYSEVLIPDAVRNELLRFHSKVPDFFQPASVRNRGAVEKLLTQLDAGEAEAIVLVKERCADVLLIDEIAGRDVAAREGIRFIGLLGVLDEAKATGLISSVKSVLREIEEKTTFCISSEMKTLALKQSGEL